MTELQSNVEKLQALLAQKKQLAYQLRETPVMAVKPVLEKYLDIDSQADDLQFLINDDYSQFMAEFEG